MSTDYNTISEQYKRSKLTPWRTHIEQYTLLGLLGEVRGKSVIDLACGEGYYSRLIKAGGASRVVGLDLSSKMIELARGDEEESQLGVEYLVEDATAFMPEEQFDIVTAAYLLNYADTEEKLLAMCKTVARCLQPGGRFVTVNNNPSQAPDRFEATRKYGFIKSVQEELRPGTAITYTIFQDGGSFQFDNYYLSRAAHERALEASGLREIEWVEPKLSREWDSEPEYWDDFFVDPPLFSSSAGNDPGRMSARVCRLNSILKHSSGCSSVR